MGKLKLLDTPNGKIARELVDEGYPLYVSSRAAGDVNEKTKEVEIAQIFTYDIVCTPGFEEAKLAEVNESLSEKALKYINESLSTANAKKSKKKTMINEEELKIDAISKFDGTTIDEVSSPLNEEDENEETPNESEFLPIMNTNPLKEEDEKEDESEEKENKEEKSKDEETEDEEKKGVEEVSDEEKEKNRELIISIVGVDEDDNIVTNNDESEEATEEEENEKKDDIIDIEAEGKENDEETEEDEVSEDTASEKDEKEESSANEAVEKKEKLKEEVDKDMQELESILDSVKTSESVKESIVRRYPFAISLSEANFAKFASLRPKLKKRCADFIEEHEIYDVKAINELWNSPLLEEKRLHSNFLLLASEYDKELYCAAPVEVQNAIEEAAKYVALDTQEDVDLFWERTGLRQQAAQKVMNERYIAQYQQALNEHKEFQKNNPLGYAVDYISMTEEYFKNND